MQVTDADSDRIHGRSISLRCPLSNLRLSHPVRLPLCEEVFDSLSVLEKIKGLWYRLLRSLYGALMQLEQSMVRINCRESCCHSTIEPKICITSQARAVHPAGTIVTLRFTCLSVCPSGDTSERVNGGSCHVWLFWVSWLVRLPAAKEAKYVSSVDSRGTALVTQLQYHESSPRSTGLVRNGQITTNKPRSEISLVLQYSVSCKRAPWSSRLAGQLENVSPPVGRPTTCVVTL